MTSVDVSLLSARPSWIVPSILKWLTLIPLGAVFLFFAASQWAMWEAGKYLVQHSNDAVDGSSPYDWGYNLWDVAVELIWVVPSVGVLWLLSLAADKLDQLVWLNASELDRREIIRKRRRIGQL